MASDPSVNEEDLREAAAELRAKLKPLGYTVIVRRMPEWYSGPRFRIIIARVKRRSSEDDQVVWPPGFQG